MGRKLRCIKCKDVVESRSVHDFQACKCGAIFIDGGNEYTRIGGHPEDMEWVEMCADCDIREWTKVLNGVTEHYVCDECYAWYKEKRT